jgi:DNA polymerase-1
MPDLLREQFPHFRPIVEAFGYRNLEFEGWEADDVIATLGHARRARRASRRAVVSTDRDAFQLCSAERRADDDTARSRGRQRLHGRSGSRRATASAREGADFIGLKGDTSDNIPGVPGIGDKTAGQLIAQYGSLEGVIEHADELSPGRAQEHHRARRPGARLEAARDDAARPRASTATRPSSCSRRPTARS